MNNDRVEGEIGEDTRDVQTKFGARIRPAVKKSLVLALNYYNESYEERKGEEVEREDPKRSVSTCPPG